MKFFKPEDFHRYWMGNVSTCSSAQAAEDANAKLEREGLVMFSTEDGDWETCNPKTKYDYKALLINVEPIECHSKKGSPGQVICPTCSGWMDPPCTHPKEKVKMVTTEVALNHEIDWKDVPHSVQGYILPKTWPVNTWQCECGTKVRPVSFEETK